MFELHFWNFLKRKILPKSLLSRFFLIIIVPTLIGQFFALRLFYERHWNDVLYRTSALIITEIEYLIQDKEILNKYHNQEQTYLNLSYIFLKNKKISLIIIDQKSNLYSFIFEKLNLNLEYKYSKCF